MLSSAETSWPPTLPRPPQLPLSSPTLPPQPSRFQQPPPPPTSLFLQPEAREPPACKPTLRASSPQPAAPAAPATAPHPSPGKQTTGVWLQPPPPPSGHRAASLPPLPRTSLTSTTPAHSVLPLPLSLLPPPSSPSTEGALLLRRQPALPLTEQIPVLGWTYFQISQVATETLRSVTKHCNLTPLVVTTQLLAFRHLNMQLHQLKMLR